MSIELASKAGAVSWRLQPRALPAKQLQHPHWWVQQTILLKAVVLFTSLVPGHEHVLDCPGR